MEYSSEEETDFIFVHETSHTVETTSEESSNVIDEELKKISGTGSFWVFAFVSIAMGISSTAYYAYSLSFLELQPSYLCNVDKSPVKYEC